jgi:hypothetical protein
MVKTQKQIEREADEFAKVGNPRHDPRVTELIFFLGDEWAKDLPSDCDQKCKDCYPRNKKRHCLRLKEKIQMLRNINSGKEYKPIK